MKQIELKYGEQFEIKNNKSRPINSERRWKE